MPSAPSVALPAENMPSSAKLQKEMPENLQMFNSFRTFAHFVCVRAPARSGQKRPRNTEWL
jgi:hypothetical protein